MNGIFFRLIRKSFLAVATYLSNMSIFRKIFLGMICILFLCIVMSTYFSYINSISVYEKEVFKNAVTLAENINESFEEYTEQFDKIVVSIYANPDVLNALDRKTDNSNVDVYHTYMAMQRFYNQLLYMVKEFRGLYYYVSEDKSDSYRLEGIPRLGYDPRDEEWFRKTLSADGKVVVFPPHHPYYLDDASEVISFARVLKDYRYHVSDPLAVIMVDISPGFIKTIIKKANLSEKTGVFFVDDSGKILYSNQVFKMSDKIYSEIANKIEEKSVGKFTTSGENGKYLVIYSTSKVTGWNLLIMTPYDEIVKDGKKILFVNLLIALITLIFSASISYAFSRLIFRPICKIQKGIALVKNGDFNFQLEPVSNDELGLLVESFNSMVKTINTLIFKQYEEKIARIEAELKYLQSQINPHFLYNTLQIISSMAIVKKVPDISTISKSLARMLRYSISTKSKIVPLKEELENLISYLEIQKLRFKSYLNYTIRIDDNAEQYNILKLVLQPIVENAIIHGIEKKGEPGNIDIHAYVENGCLCIDVTDDGAGMSEEKIRELMRSINSQHEADRPEDTEHNSIGLQNIQKRIRLIYGPEYGISIRSEKGIWTEVKITIPASQ